MSTLDTPKHANIEIHGTLSEDFQQAVAEATRQLQELQKAAHVTLTPTPSAEGESPAAFPTLGTGGKGLPGMAQTPAGGGSATTLPSQSTWLKLAESLSPVWSTMRRIMQR